MSKGKIGGLTALIIVFNVIFVLTFLGNSNQKPPEEKVFRIYYEDTIPATASEELQNIIEKLELPEEELAYLAGFRWTIRENPAERYVIEDSEITVSYKNLKGNVKSAVEEALEGVSNETEK